MLVAPPIWSDVPAVLFKSMRVVPDKVTVLVTVSVPMVFEPPGTTVAPELANKLPLTVPLPCKTWPVFRVSFWSERPLTSITALAAMLMLELPPMEPLPTRASVLPERISVMPWYVLAAANTTELS